MQQNKNFRPIFYIFFGYPGWSPGITVCLGTSRVCSIQSHRKIDDNFFRIFSMKNYPPIFCPFIRNPPLPKTIQLKNKQLKKRSGINVLFYIRTKSLCI